MEKARSRFCPKCKKMVIRFMGDWILVNSTFGVIMNHAISCDYDLEAD